MKALAVEIELLLFAPRPAHEIEPLGGIFIAVIVWTHVGAEHVELVLEPAAYHVHGEAPAGDVIDGARHLRCHQRMHQRHVYRGEYRAIARHRPDRGSPGEAFKGAVVEVRGPAITLPSAHRQQRL